MAGRRTVLEDIPFVQGWGVELALLLEIAKRHGVEAIVEVDLGERVGTGTTSSNSSRCRRRRCSSPVCAGPASIRRPAWST